MLWLAEWRAALVENALNQEAYAARTSSALKPGSVCRARVDIATGNDGSCLVMHLTNAMPVANKLETEPEHSDASES
jgi:hypothetical protein